MLTDFPIDSNCKITMQLADFLVFMICMKESTEKEISEFVDCADKEGRNSVNQNIDYLIDISITNEKHDITAYLLDYKQKHNLYKENNWEL